MSVPTHEEIAFRVCTAFENEGLEVVLVGGACAEIYGGPDLATRDADFVCQFQGRMEKERQLMAGLGFRYSGTRSVYASADVPDFTVDLVTGPVLVGERVLREFAVRRDGDRILRMLRPEDVVCDRLAIFLYERDESNLDRAAAVLKATGVSPQAIGAWLDEEEDGGAREIRARRRLGLPPRASRILKT